VRIVCGFTERTNTSLLAAYPFLSTDPVWGKVYAPEGTLLKKGDTVYRKKFAETLELSADLFFSLGYSQLPLLVLPDAAPTRSIPGELRRILFPVSVLPADSFVRRAERLLSVQLPRNAVGS
jgi:hypothetical protein